MHSLKFSLLDANNEIERQAWIHYWEQWPEREIFAHPEYVRLYAGSGERALCAAASCDGSYILYPFLLRSLSEESYCDLSLRDSTDIVTPYGYGGPFRWGKAWNPEELSEFWKRFVAWVSQARVVSEVVRLSLFPDTLAEYAGDSHVVADNVVLKLRSEKELWPEFEHKVRKNVNRARASGVTVDADETGHCLDNFMAIYTSTMDRRNAGQTYYFSREYFERIHQTLKGQFMYFFSRVGATVVSAELVLVSAERVYSFLGGTNADWFHVRPNDLLKMEIMNWAYSAGKKEFVMGGGYERGDGIYHYKLAFAPHGSVPFSIGSRIFDADAYQQLVACRRRFAASQAVEWHPKPDFFPAYRG